MLLLANSKNIVFKRIKPVPAFSFSRFTFSLLQKLFIIIALFGSINSFGQSTVGQKEEYKKVIQQRAAKIVNTLGIADSGEYNKVVGIIAQQYFSLNNLQEVDQSAIASLNQQSLEADNLAAELKKQSDKKSLQLKQLHNDFIAQLKNKITDVQVEKVKDGMTYNVLPVTYTAYLDMLPNLTTEQQERIYSWLKEARELAMDGESSEKKHQIFGKYKGKINNYLSAAGYDMKKEGKEWQKRLKEREEKKKNSQ